MGKKEILYRAKSKAKGEWLYGHVFEEFFYRFKEGWVKEWVLQPFREKVTDAGCRQIVDANTICDYTGLTDKNGTKIFEGDIIRYENGFGVVMWAKDHAYMCIEEEGENWEWFDNIFFPSVEVVGNKFDNPELLLEVK